MLVFTSQGLCLPLFPRKTLHSYLSQSSTQLSVVYRNRLKKQIKNKISISFIKYPNCNLIKLLWDAANQLQVSLNRRIARLSRKCGFHPNLFRQQHTKRESIWTARRLLVQWCTFRNLPYSPKSHRRDSNTDRTRVTDSPGSMSPSVHSSEDHPRSRITSHTSRPQSSRNGN